MIVLDASATVELLLGTPAGHGVLERVRGHPLHAPHLLSVEVTQAIRGLVARRDVSELEARRCIDDLRELPLRRWRHEPLLDRVWEMRGGVTAYDGVYVALAEALGAPVVTTDARLARAKGHQAQVVLVR